MSSPDRTALFPGLLCLPVLEVVAVGDPEVSHGQGGVTASHLPLHEVRVDPGGESGGAHVEGT